MKRTLVVLIALVAGTATATAGYASAADAPKPVVRTAHGVVRIVIHHSRFTPDHLVVAKGTTLRFTIDNRDPIAHEFILGDDEVQRRHEAGTEAVHPPVPGELSLRPVERRPTIYTFDHAGTVVFACHLPGHFAYGMRGRVQVVSGAGSRRTPG